jgi:hypothetical protein
VLRSGNELGGKCCGVVSTSACVLACCGLRWGGAQFILSYGGGVVQGDQVHVSLTIDDNAVAA